MSLKFLDAEEVSLRKCNRGQDQASTGLKPEKSQGAAGSELNLATFEQNRSNYDVKLAPKKS